MVSWLSCVPVELAHTCKDAVCICVVCFLAHFPSTCSGFAALALLVPLGRAGVRGGPPKPLGLPPFPCSGCCGVGRWMALQCFAPAFVAVPLKGPPHFHIPISSLCLPKHLIHTSYTPHCLPTPQLGVVMPLFTSSCRCLSLCLKAIGLLVHLK